MKYDKILVIRDDEIDSINQSIISYAFRDISIIEIDGISYTIWNITIISILRLTPSCNVKLKSTSDNTLIYGEILLYL